MTKVFPILGMLIGCASGLVAQAETCKYLDHEGKTTYSNYPIRNAEKIVCFDATPATAPEPEPAPAVATKPATKTVTKSKEMQRSFPRIDKATQRNRDMGRRKILEEELTDELQLLDQARQALTADTAARDSGALRDPRTSADRAQPLREAVELHQRNIEAIENELKRIR